MRNLKEKLLDDGGNILNKIEEIDKHPLLLEYILSSFKSKKIKPKKYFYISIPLDGHEYIVDRLFKSYVEAFDFAHDGKDIPENLLYEMFEVKEIDVASSFA